MAEISITEAAVREIASSESYQRGVEYYRDGAVTELVRRGNRLHAQVEGSDYDPYEVSVTLDAATLEDATCTCPYDWGGACKHTVATLLAFLRSDEEIEEKPSLESLLDGLNRDQLQALVVDLAEQHPEILPQIEEFVVAKFTGEPESPASPKTKKEPSLPPPLDLTLLKKQLRGAMRSSRSSYRDYDDSPASGMADDILEVMSQADPYLEAGDGHSAIKLLALVTDEVADDSVFELDYNGDFTTVFEDLGSLWAEAILSADLSEAEREKLKSQLLDWESEGADYGYDGYFDAALLALAQGWDYPPLQRVLAGEITEKGAWEDEAPSGADELSLARLKVLNQQNRLQEYLYLAEAEGETDLFLAMLVRMGRTQEAVEYALKYVAASGEALNLARLLEEKGALEDAMRVAEQGLQASEEYNEQHGRRGELAVWLRNAAKNAGQTERALKAALTAVKESVSLENYLAVEALSGEKWPERREELLTHLRQNPGFHRDSHVDIYLHEVLIDDAIRIANASYSSSVVERVADAAAPTHPLWVFETAQKRFNAIADEKKSQHYGEAAAWLARARDAMTAAGRRDEWKAFVESMKEKHARKYSLMPRLKEL